MKKTLLQYLIPLICICLRKAYNISEVVNSRENTLENVQAHSNISNGQMSSKIIDFFSLTINVAVQK